jgi:hypothetical protein
MSVGSLANADTQTESFPVPVSVNALMVTLIDHSAHYVWDYAAKEEQINEREWRAVEYYAIQLAASGPLITLGGTGRLDDAWAAEAKWQQHSRAMSDAAVLALEAATEKDKEKLNEAGFALLESCEGCHEDFKPAVPTEGIMHDPGYDHLYHLLNESD